MSEALQDVADIEEFIGDPSIQLTQKQYTDIQGRLANIRRALEQPEQLFVVFDGPPSHESGRFVEVENQHGFSVGGPGLNWTQGDSGLWYLGPLKRGE